MSKWLRSGDKELVEQRYGISYEGFINSILEQHFEKKHIKYAKTSQGDYFLSLGYKNEESCYVFHVYRPMWTGANAFTNKIQFIQHFNCKNAIGIYTGDISEESDETEGWLISVYKSFETSGINFELWRYNEFRKNVEGLYDDALKDALIKTNLLNKYINSDTPSIQNIVEKNSEDIANLTKLLHDDRLCLVLGAGVSAASNLPLWTEIVSKFMSVLVEKSFLAQGIQLPDEQYEIIAKEMYHIKDDSPLSKMRFIKNAFKDDEFYSILYKLLYKNCDLKIDTDLLVSA